jgi:AcrR family transcriptional regulator
LKSKLRERKERGHDKLRERILDAARELFAKEGYENVSMRKVAEKISYSPTTIYLHFRDKAELFDCLCNEMYAKLAELPQSIADVQADPLVFLKKVLRAYVQLGLANPNQYAVAFLLSSKSDMKPEDFLPHNSKALRAYDAFREAVKACVRQKMFRKVNVDAASQALWATAHGLTSLLILFPTFPWADREHLIEVTLDSLIRGLMRNTS